MRSLPRTRGPATVSASRKPRYRLTDLLLDKHTLTDKQRAEALTLLTVNQLADFVLTVGFYQLVCNFLNTFGVTPEGEGTGV